MAYISKDDFNRLGYELVNADKFEQFRQSAEMAIDRATMDFYRLHDINADVDILRAEDFKRSICEMIVYFDYQGTGKSYELDDNSYQNVTVGRLHLQPGNSAMPSDKKSGLTNEAYYLLAIHGLLNRGVAHL